MMQCILLAFQLFTRELRFRQKQKGDFELINKFDQ